MISIRKSLLMVLTCTVISLQGEKKTVFSQRIAQARDIKKDFCKKIEPFADILSETEKFAVCQLCQEGAVCDKQLTSLVKGQRVYMPIKDITPGQVRYSAMNVQEKVDKALERKSAVKKGDTHVLAFDNGKSILELEVALPLLKARDGYVLLDGHHDLLSSMRLGAQTVPVEVKEEMADMSIHDQRFWQKAEDKKLVFLYNLNGERVKELPRFDAMQDDANRFFVTLILHRCNTKDGVIVKDYAISDKVYGHKTPVLIKIDKDIPFLEFYVGDLLRKYGVQYHNNQGKDFGTLQSGDALVDLAEKSRDVLREHGAELLRQGISLKLIPHKAVFSREMCEQFLPKK